MASTTTKQYLNSVPDGFAMSQELHGISLLAYILVLSMTLLIQGWNCCAICTILNHSTQAAHGQSLAPLLAGPPKPVLSNISFLISVSSNLQYGSQLATVSMFGLAIV